MTKKNNVLMISIWLCKELYVKDRVANRIKSIAILWPMTLGYPQLDLTAKVEHIRYLEME